MALKDYFLVLRPINCIIAAIGAFTGFALSVNSIASSFVFSNLLGMISVFLICGAGQAINDFFDVKIDKKKNAQRVLSKGTASSKSIFVYSLFLFLLGIIVSFSLGLMPFLIAVIFSIILFLYSALLGKTKFFGNWIIALSSAFAIVFGASIIGNYFLALILALSAFIASGAREIIKDLEDKEADRGLKVSLSHLFPENAIFSFVAFLLILAVFVGFYPFFAGIFSSAPYLFLMFFSSFVFALCFYFLLNKRFNNSHNACKIAMFFGLLAFLAAIA